MSPDNLKRTVSIAMLGSIAILALLLGFIGGVKFFDLNDFQQQLTSNAALMVLSGLGLMMFVWSQTIPRFLKGKQPDFVVHTIKVSLLEGMALNGFVTAVLSKNASLFGLYALIAGFAILLTLTPHEPTQTR